MNISDAGAKFIHSFEGCRLDAYDDLQPKVKITSAAQVKGTLTIGWGHTGDVKVGQVITQDQADALFLKDIKEYVDAVNGLVKVDITQNMMDALTSFCYNCGPGALQKSKMLQLINQKDFINAAKEFAQYCHSGGQVLTGLVRRRAAEASLFLTNVVSDGWAKDDHGKWSFYKGGQKQKGWIQDKGNWYFLDSVGIMSTGWVKIKGDWYYLSPAGFKDYKGISHPEGSMIIGWLQEKGKWYYLATSGKMLTGLIQVDGKWYHLKPNGELTVSGTLKTDANGVIQI
jgi:lysozyme